MGGESLARHAKNDVKRRNWQQQQWRRLCCDVANSLIDSRPTAMDHSGSLESKINVIITIESRQYMSKAYADLTCIDVFGIDGSTELGVLSRQPY